MKPAPPIVFATPAYEYLAEAILRRGFGVRAELERKTFPDGEQYQRILDDVSGRDTVLVGGTITDSDTLEIFDLACALARNDDMIRTGSSLLQAAQAYRDAGAKAVFAVATHGVFPGDALARITATGLLDGLACTDTHPNVLGLPRAQVHVESVAGMLTDYLKGSR